MSGHVTVFLPPILWMFDDFVEYNKVLALSLTSHLLRNTVSDLPGGGRGAFLIGLWVWHECEDISQSVLCVCVFVCVYLYLCVRIRQKCDGMVEEMCSIRLVHACKHMHHRVIGVCVCVCVCAGHKATPPCQ